MVAAESWDSLLGDPFREYHVVILASCAFWFALMAASHAISERMSVAYRALDNEKKLDWVVRVCSIVHAVQSWVTIYGWVYPTAEAAADPFYGPLQYPTSMAITTGYFLWDIIISIYFGWGAAFIAHAFTSFSVFYFGLRPFLPVHGCFYLGVFEISSPWIHLNAMIELAGMKGTVYDKVTGILFAITFTIVRVLLGVYVSFFWWIGMVDLIVTGTAHSVFVVCLYLFCNGVLMALQLFWWSVILKAAAGIEDAKDDKKD